MENIISAIQNEEWEEALNLYVECTKNQALDDKLCILGATILEHFNARDELFEMIHTGIKFNWSNYELYLLLGNYYSANNSDKAYLCYENALYYAIKSNNEDDVAVIKSIINSYIQSNEVQVRNLSLFVLADGNEQNKQQCLDSINRFCFEGCYELGIVDVSDYRRRTVSVNEAISNANKENDVVLISGDRVITPNSLFTLRMALYDNNQIGVASSVSFNDFPDQKKATNKTDNDAFIEYGASINIPEENALEEKTIVDGGMVIIRRALIDDMGALSEQIVTERSATIDLCLTSVNKGYQNVLCWNSYAFRDSKSTRPAIDIEVKAEEKRMLKEKWGFTAEYYMPTRKELADMIDRAPDSEISVLEVGAGLGSTLTYIKHKYPKAEVCGIEIVESVVKYAAKHVNMKCDNIETYTFGENEKYDYIIFGDVLEHLVDPYSLVERLKEHLNPGGCIIASIPNILNAGAIYEILHGGFEYKNSGILDSTHLRFFTKREIIRLFHTRGYEIIKMVGIYGAENSHAFGDFFDKLMEIDGIVDRSEFDMLQYAVCARVIDE